MFLVLSGRVSLDLTLVFCLDCFFIFDTVKQRSLERDALSLIGEVVLAVTLELGGESPVILLLSNLSSLGHLDVVWDKLGEGYMRILAWFEIDDSFVEEDDEVEREGG